MNYYMYCPAICPTIYALISIYDLPDGRRLAQRPSSRAAHDFGYSPGAFRVLCHQFRHNPQPAFFLTTHPGPRHQPRKSAARSVAIALRKQNHSIYEIGQLLKSQNLPLSPTAVGELLKAEGFAPLPRRLDEEPPLST